LKEHSFENHAGNPVRRPSEKEALFYTYLLETSNQLGAGCVTTNGVAMQLIVTNAKLSLAVALALVLGACHRSNEAPITGKRSDPPVSMQAVWQPGKRYLYRVESTTSSQVPRKNTTRIIHADTTIGQDLAFAVTNIAPDGSRLLQMEILAVQMETGRDDGVTVSFDSANRVMEVEETPLVERLKRFVGLKLRFHVSPENKVTRVDGTKELNDRGSGGASVRGVAGAALSRCFNQQFYRDIVEMGMLPKDPVKVGDTWNVSRTGSGGLRGGSVAMDLTYTFRGWQRREGTNCARLDFSGTFKPNAPAPKGSQTNSPSFVRRVIESVVPPNVEEGEITGQSWFDRELQLAVETRYQQSITTKSTNVRRVRTKADTNESVVVETVSSTNAPSASPPEPPPTNAPAQKVTTSTTSSEQYTVVKLLEVEPLDR
jgi:hypothetical protein